MRAQPRCGGDYPVTLRDYLARRGLRVQMGIEPRIGLDRCTQCGLHLKEELRDSECR
jgi:hypothetical protein